LGFTAEQLMDPQVVFILAPAGSKSTSKFVRGTFWTEGPWQGHSIFVFLAFI
jgi:hypothetical protein